VGGQRNFLPTPLPSMIAGEPATGTIGGLNIAVAATTRHRDLAFDAMVCLRDRDNQRRDGIEAGLPPTLASLYDDPSFQAAYPMWREVRDSLTSASMRPASPAYQSISTLMTAKLAPVTGIADPAALVPVLAQQVRDAVTSKGLVP
jgi:multiple sugar transport system substrate-binding protein